MCPFHIQAWQLTGKHTCICQILLAICVIAAGNAGIIADAAAFDLMWWNGLCCKRACRSDPWCGQHG